MNDENIKTKDIESNNIADRLSSLESSLNLLNYKINNEIPSDLSDRLIIIEQKNDYEFNSLKKELSEAKLVIKEKYTLYVIIVTLIIALITSVVTLIKGWM